MSKRKSALEQARRGEFPARKEPVPEASFPKSPRRWSLIFLFLAISLGGCWLVFAFRPNLFGVPVYTFRQVQQFPHDPLLFTQGLFLDSDEVVYESHGQYGQSGLRKYELATGRILEQRKLDPEYFGEGLARFNDRLFQLTWKEGKALVYDLNLQPLHTFEYEGEGWGLAATETELVMSNGTHRLSFRNPETFAETRFVFVRVNGRQVAQLNELEYHNGKIYANQLYRDLVYEIDPLTGDVTAVIELQGLWPAAERPDGGVLNGIAVLPRTRRMFVTGKYCPHLFEIELIPK